MSASRGSSGAPSGPGAGETFDRAYAAVVSSPWSQLVFFAIGLAVALRLVVGAQREDAGPSAIGVIGVAVCVIGVAVALRRLVKARGRSADR